MLKHFFIFCLLIGMRHSAQAQHLQLIENRGEIGLYLGKSSYRGDIAPDLLNFNQNFGAYYKKQYNDYAGLRLNYELLSISSNDTLSNNIYAKYRGFIFSRQFHDISLMGEFYFTRFLPGNKGYRFSPYLGIGAGYLFNTNASNFRFDSLSSMLLPLKIDSVNFPKLSANKGIVHLPVQIGFKLNLSQRWNIFGEVMYRFALSDELDFFPDEQLLKHTQKVATGNSVYNYQGSRTGMDQLFSVKVGMSYNLYKIYGEERWQPEKRSKMARRRDKHARQQKPGFFSRLKFKRK